MKQLGCIALVLVAASLFCGCMSDREYMLRRANAANQAAHAQTFDVVTIKGPVSIGEGASVTAASPTQPFQPLPIPDGVEAQRGMVRDIVTGAVLGYGLHQAGGDSTVNNSSNSHNSTGGAE